MNYFKHPTAEIGAGSKIGKNTKIWHYVQIRENAQIGENCILGNGTYIDVNVTVGNNVKIQNGACVYDGATIEDGVFIGPKVILTNDKNPRSVNASGALKTSSDWSISPILVKKGASVGAGSVVLPGTTIGRYALIGAGSVVTQDVPDYTLAYGNPARSHGIVNKEGLTVKRLHK